MSVLLTAAARKSTSRSRKRVIREAGYSLNNASQAPRLTHSWDIKVDGSQVTVSFSRDNLHVWINGSPVKVTAYITDKGMDVDLYFTMMTHEGHIFSDVEGKRMVNTLLIDDISVAKHKFKE